MREQIIQALAVMLQNNLGQRLTPELATGIATSLNQFMVEQESRDEPGMVADV